MKIKNKFYCYDVLKSYIFIIIIQLLLTLIQNKECNNCKISDNYTNCESVSDTDINEDNCDCNLARPHIDNKCYNCSSFNTDNYIIYNGVCNQESSCNNKIIFESKECVSHCPDGYCEFGVYCYNKKFLNNYNFSNTSSFQECQCINGLKKIKINESKNIYECVEHCTGGNYTYNYDKGECIEKCKSNDRTKLEKIEENIFALRCSSKCMQGEYYYKNDACLDECFEDKYIYENYDGSKECVDECNKDDIYNYTL